jgi:hypothetical protein
MKGRKVNAIPEFPRQNNLISIWESGANRMNRHKGAGSNWIGSLVEELDLFVKDPVTDVSRFRALLEECRLPERIRQTVVAVHRELGYAALDLLDFLPPQRSILLLSFCKKKTEYVMEIVLRTTGPAVVFHSVTRTLGSWERYIYGYSRSTGSRIAFNQSFMPVEITDETVKVWFSFLLSEFDKKFDPGMCMQQPKIPDFDSGGFSNKASV